MNLFARIFWLLERGLIGERYYGGLIVAACCSEFLDAHALEQLVSQIEAVGKMRPRP